MPYDVAYTWNLKNTTNQNRKRLAEAANNLTVARVEGYVWGGQKVVRGPRDTDF